MIQRWKIEETQTNVFLKHECTKKIAFRKNGKNISIIYVTLVKHK